MDTLIILFLAALIGYGWYFILTRYQAGENKEKSGWLKLASSNNLNFKPAYLFRTNATVTGNYRGYHLNLCTFKQKRHRKKPDQVYTYLALSSPRSNHLISGQGTELGNPLSIKEVTALLTPKGFRYKLKGQIEVKPNARKLSYEQVGFERSEKYLQFVCDLLADLGDAYNSLVALGGEVVPALREILEQTDQSLSPIAHQLLADIGRETTDRLASRISNVLCPQCLTHFIAHQIYPNSWHSNVYYGCRNCGQSREYAEGVRVVAVLDHRMTTEQVQQNGVLRVNWLMRRRLFDFDEVNIIDAIDEDIERFAVQVGNDVDVIRQSRYKEMFCTITPGVSENSMWVLDKVFGHLTSTEAVV